MIPISVLHQVLAQAGIVGIPLSVQIHEFVLYTTHNALIIGALMAPLLAVGQIHHCFQSQILHQI